MNLDEVLERLTARINPRRFPLGVETSRIRAELAEGHAENSIKTGISVLADQCHIDVYPGRYKVGKRRLIRTMDDRLVLAGARGPSLIERLVQHGFTCEAMQLREGNNEFTLTQISISADDCPHGLEDLVGPVPEQPTSLSLLAGTPSQQEWFAAVPMEPIGGNPFAVLNGEPVTFLSLDTWRFGAHSPGQLDVYVTRRGRGYQLSTRWLQRREDHSGFEGRMLQTLDDRRRAQFRFMELNGRIPLQWSREDETLTVPAFFHLPPVLTRAISMASMRLPEYITIDESPFPMPARRYRNITEPLMEQVTRCIWIGDEDHE